MSKPTLAIIVPARLASTRFPEKLLHPIQGKPLLLWTVERLAAVAPEIPLYVAVDSERIAEPLKKAGYSCLETDPDLPSGTDRLAVANQTVGAEYVINIQADEPLVEGSQVYQLTELIQSPGTDIATLATPFRKESEFRDPSRVKVVLGAEGRALYFSRSPIPYERDAQGVWKRGERLLHLGMYAYRADFLQAFRSMEPGVLESLERLEQLRALEAGYTIRVGITDIPTFGIDTMEDVESFARHLEKLS